MVSFHNYFNPIIIESTLKGLRDKDFEEFFDILVEKDVNLAKTYSFFCG